MKNRRVDKRLLLPDVQIKVKKSDRRPAFVDCTPVDISFNGLAFCSDSLQLEALQKIDFQLTISNRTLSGQAVVCDVAQLPDRCRYGVLYIAMEPAIEDVFGLKTLSSTYVRELAVTMADNAIASQKLSEEEYDLNKAWAMLSDGVDVFRQRLCEHKTNADALNDLFVLNTKERRITLPLMADDNSNVVMIHVSPARKTDTQQMYLQLSDGRKIATMMELLQELSEAFAFIFAQEAA